MKNIDLILVRFIILELQKEVVALNPTVYIKGILVTCRVSFFTHEQAISSVNIFRKEIISS